MERYGVYESPSRRPRDCEERKSDSSDCSEGPSDVHGVCHKLRVATQKETHLAAGCCGLSLVRFSCNSINMLVVVDIRKKKTFNCGKKYVARI